MKKQLLLAILMLLPFVVNASGINPNLGFSTNEHWDANRGFVATLGQPFNSPVLSNPYNVSPIVWTSSNPEVATVDANGIVTLVSVGRSQIRATFAGDAEYAEGMAEYGLIVEVNSTEKKDPGLCFATNEHWDANRGFVGTLGEPFKSPGLVNPYNVGPIVWSSSNPEVATIDANGNVTLVSAGRTQITAYYAGDSEFIERTNEYALTLTSTLTATLATLRVYSDSHSTRQN